ncbi:MAG: DUF1624 domain-containing protein [Oscillospiraceae bacterium]|nr:DUF1624 domain-containing protein [Oscillospiraceae bacterium]
MNQQGRLDGKKQRVWEIDALRGFLILSVLINHLNITVNAFCINGYYNIDSAMFARISDPLGVWYTYDAEGILRSADWVLNLRESCNFLAVDTFFIISGIVCSFSRNNLNRALRMLGAGAFVAGFTKLLAVWTGDPTRFIRFGVLFCYAFCQLIYVYFLENKSNKILLLAMIPPFVLGYLFRYYNVEPTRLPLLYIFGVPQLGNVSSDWWPIFPMLGWFLMGVVLGRRFYFEKKTRIPCPWVSRLTAPLQWLGRHSGIIYVSHIVIYTAVFCGIGYHFGLL